MKASGAIVTIPVFDKSHVNASVAQPYLVTIFQLSTIFGA